MAGNENGVDEVLALELEAQRMELKNHLVEEVPYSCQEILTALNECSTLLSEMKLKKEFETNRVSGTETDSAGWYGLRGSLRLDGCKVVGGDIEVKFPRLNRGAPFKTAIAVNTPWLLEQAQNAQNHVQLAIEELVVLCEERSSASIKDVFEITTAVSTSINHAKEEMIMISRHTAPHTLHGTQVFDPPLGNDLVVDMCLDRAVLVIAAYSVTPATKPPMDPASHNNGGGLLIDGVQKGSTAHGQMLFLRNQWMTVGDYAECRLDITPLSNALTEMTKAYRSSIRLRDKTIAHSNFF